MTDQGERKRRAKAKALARAAPGWAQAVATAKGMAKQAEAYKTRRLGKLGPAGPCRRIDPVTGEVIEIIWGKGKEGRT
jgi:hypothetical protein